MTPEELHKELRNTGLSPFEYALMVVNKNEWQPISSIPKKIDSMVYCKYYNGKYPPIYVVGRFRSDGFYLQDGGELSFNWTPTHWKPIEPPKAE